MKRISEQDEDRRKKLIKYSSDKRVCHILNINVDIIIIISQYCDVTSLLKTCKYFYNLINEKQIIKNTIYRCLDESISFYSVYCMKKAIGQIKIETEDKFKIVENKILKLTFKLRYRAMMLLLNKLGSQYLKYLDVNLWNVEFLQKYVFESTYMKEILNAEEIFASLENVDIEFKKDLDTTIYLDEKEEELNLHKTRIKVVRYEACEKCPRNEQHSNFTSIYVQLDKNKVNYYKKIEDYTLSNKLNFSSQTADYNFYIYSDISFSEPYVNIKSNRIDSFIRSIKNLSIQELLNSSCGKNNFSIQNIIKEAQNEPNIYNQTNTEESSDESDEQSDSDVYENVNNVQYHSADLDNDRIFKLFEWINSRYKTEKIPYDSELNSLRNLEETASYISSKLESIFSTYNSLKDFEHFIELGYIEITMFEINEAQLFNNNQKSVKDLQLLRAAASLFCYDNQKELYNFVKLTGCDPISDYEYSRISCRENLTLICLLNEANHKFSSNVLLKHDLNTILHFIVTNVPAEKDVMKDTVDAHITYLVMNRNVQILPSGIDPFYCLLFAICLNNMGGLKAYFTKINDIINNGITEINKNFFKNVNIKENDSYEQRKKTLIDNVESRILFLFLTNSSIKETFGGFVRNKQIIKTLCENGMIYIAEYLVKTYIDEIFNEYLFFGNEYMYKNIEKYINECCEYLFPEYNFREITIHQSVLKMISLSKNNIKEFFEINYPSIIKIILSSLFYIEKSYSKSFKNYSICCLIYKFQDMFDHTSYRIIKYSIDNISKVHNVEKEFLYKAILNEENYNKIVGLGECEQLSDIDQLF